MIFISKKVVSSRLKRSHFGKSFNQGCCRVVFKLTLTRRGDGEVVRGQPSRIVELGLILLPHIAKNGHDGTAGTVFPDPADSAGEIDPGG